MSRIISIKCDNSVSVIDVNLDDFEAIGKAIAMNDFEAPFLESVTPFRLYTELDAPTGAMGGIGVRMLVDEEGLLKSKPINPIASYLYGTDKHGGYIVGDCLLVAEIHGDFTEIPEAVCNKLLKGIEEMQRQGYYECYLTMLKAK